MGIVEKIGVWLKQVVMLPTNLAKVASINQQLELQQELAETQNRLKQAEDRLAADAAIKAGRMFLDDNALWAKDEKGHIEKAPYCARCFELDGKAVHLVVRHRPRPGPDAVCPQCKTEIDFGRIHE